jgi:predicted restriction endonuclease
VLRASHISPWSDDPENRLNPSNGILLAATYDAAFDQHLMSFDEDGRMVLSPALKEHHGQEAFIETFLKLEGRRLARPQRHPPSAALMARHREGLVG